MDIDIVVDTLCHALAMKWKILRTIAYLNARSTSTHTRADRREQQNARGRSNTCQECRTISLALVHRSRRSANVLQLQNHTHTLANIVDQFCTFTYI